jgi:NADH-quinone oxidoreductase subunit G
VSLEVRAGAVSPLADVVLPVAPVAEKPGTFVDWEGRVRPFEKVLRDSNALPDLRVLAGIAEELGVDLGFKTVEQARTEMAELGAWDGERVTMGSTGGRAPTGSTGSTSGGLRLATWKLLIDDGRMLDGEDYLKATARTPVVLVSAGTLAELGLTPGQEVSVTAARGSTRLPVAVADLPDGVVWAPSTSQWSAPAGSEVRIDAADGGHA